jgi:RimJ/RimL family protein N-acetyltransferase
MSPSPTLRVAPVDASLHDALLQLRVRPPQQAFVGRIADLLADANSRPSCEPMAILSEHAPIGFYCIETRVRTIAGRDFDAPALGLRGFFIDTGWQGRGLGRRALRALFADLATRHPEARLLALTVNRSNEAALALYLGAGFVDGGELYHGGRAGPQHLLLRPLPV